jgi:hypothetical protein
MVAALTGLFGTTKDQSHQFPDTSTKYRKRAKDGQFNDGLDSERIARAQAKRERKGAQRTAVQS